MVAAVGGDDGDARQAAKYKGPVARITTDKGALVCGWPLTATWAVAGPGSQVKIDGPSSSACALSCSPTFHAL